MEAESKTVGKEILVISGSSGLIGSALIKRVAEKYLVIGLDNAGPPYPPPEAECLTIDITSDEGVKKAFMRIKEKHGNRIASIIHLAAYYDFSGKSSPLYEEITVKGTERLLRVLQDFKVEQFIFSSSLLVYDPTVPGKKITEDSPVNPKWAYPKSKVRTEKILFTKRGKVPVLNLRIAGVYNDEGNSIPIAHHIQRIYEKRITSHFFPGNVNHGNPFLHLDDLTDAISKAVEKRTELPAELTLNLGEPETMSFMDLQQTISRLLYGKEWKTYRVPKLLAKAGAWVQNIFTDAFIKPWMIDVADDHMELDISRAKKWLGWKPFHSLRETLPDIIKSLKADPEKWYKTNKLKK